MFERLDPWKLFGQWWRMLPTRRALPRLATIVAMTAAALPQPAAADNGIGAWSTLSKWPLVPLHAILLPDGRVLTYGTNSDGSQTGRFIYDIWSPSRGLGAVSHWTLPNKTAVDLFCSAQIIVPRTGDIALMGGDNWTGTRTNNYGNNSSAIFSTANNDILVRGADMNQARWYATVTTLPNGQTYVQGGLGPKGGLPGEARPEIRDVAGNFRLLNNISTTSLNWWYPRNWVAPDGRIFGYSDRTMYYVNPNGNGSMQRLG